MLCYGLLTNPSNEILDEITKAYELDFDYVEIGIEGPEGNPLIIEKKRNEILKLKQQAARSINRELSGYFKIVKFGDGSQV